MSGKACVETSCRRRNSAPPFKEPRVELHPVLAHNSNTWICSSPLKPVKDTSIVGLSGNSGTRASAKTKHHNVVDVRVKATSSLEVNGHFLCGENLIDRAAFRELNIVSRVGHREFFTEVGNPSEVFLQNDFARRLMKCIGRMVSYVEDLSGLELLGHVGVSGVPRRHPRMWDNEWRAGPRVSPHCTRCTLGLI